MYTLIIFVLFHVATAQLIKNAFDPSTFTRGDLIREYGDKPMSVKFQEAQCYHQYEVFEPDTPHARDECEIYGDIISFNDYVNSDKKGVLWEDYVPACKVREERLTYQIYNGRFKYLFNYNDTRLGMATVMIGLKGNWVPIHFHDRKYNFLYYGVKNWTLGNNTFFQYPGDLVIVDENVMHNVTYFEESFAIVLSVYK
jgi:hypothetical protein